MGKVGNKSLFGSMVFLTVFLLIVLSTVVYMLVQTVNKKIVARPINETSVVSRTAEPVFTVPKAPVANKALTRFKAATKRFVNRSKAVKSFKLFNPDFATEFERIERGEGILEEINEAMELFVGRILPSGGLLDEMFNAAEYPSKPTFFGAGHTVNGHVHTFDLINALNVPGSRGQFIYHTREFKDPDKVTLDQYCRDEGLKMVWDEAIINYSGRYLYHVAYLIETDAVEYGEHMINGFPFEDLLDSSPIESDKKFACIIAYHPDDSVFPAQIVAKRKTSRLRIHRNYVSQAFHIVDAMGIPGSDSLFICPSTMHFQFDREQAPISDAISRFFNSVETYGIFLKLNRLQYADNNSFMGPDYNYTVHYASKDQSVFHLLKVHIEEVVEAIYAGAWGYPEEHATLKNSKVLDLLDRDDTAILIVKQPRNDSADVSLMLPDFNRVISNYAFIDESKVDQPAQAGWFGSSSEYVTIGMAKLLQIEWEGKRAYYFKYLYLDATAEQAKEAPLNMVINGEEIKISEPLHHSITGREQEIADNLRDYSKLKNPMEMLGKWKSYLTTITYQNNFPSLEVIITIE